MHRVRRRSSGSNRVPDGSLFGSNSRLRILLRQVPQLLLQHFNLCYSSCISHLSSASLHFTGQVPPTSSVPLNLLFLELYPAPVYQLIRERRHKQDFGHRSREGLVEANLIRRKISVLVDHTARGHSWTATTERGSKESLHEEKPASVPEPA